MGYFATDAELHEHLGGTFTDLLADPKLSERLRRTDTTFLLQLEKPRTAITVRLMPNEEPVVDLGKATVRPEVALQMDADVAHQFFLGRINPTSALSAGTIKTRGPVAKVLRVLPLVEVVADRYRERIEGAGRDDLLAAEPPETPVGAPAAGPSEEGREPVPAPDAAVEAAQAEADAGLGEGATIADPPSEADAPAEAVADTEAPAEAPADAPPAEGDAPAPDQPA